MQRIQFICLLSIVYCLLFTASLAQPPCGTVMDEATIGWLKQYAQHPTFDAQKTNGTYYVPIQFHITREDDGTGYITVRNAGANRPTQCDRYAHRICGRISREYIRKGTAIVSVRCRPGRRPQ